MTSAPHRNTLPYWALLPANASSLDAVSGQPSAVPCVLLKDGTLALGVSIPAHGSVDRGLPELLDALPDGGFVHAIAQGREVAPRQRCHALQPSLLTYWLGVKRYMQKELPNHQRFDRQARCDNFLRCLLPALQTLQRRVGRISFASAKEIVHSCHQIYYGENNRQVTESLELSIAPLSPWSDGFLENQIGHPRMELNPSYLSIAPPNGHTLYYVQASSVSSLSSVAQMSATTTLEPEMMPPGVLVSICHEKRNQKQQRERLEQRNRWLHTLLGNPSFHQDEAQQAREQASQLLQAIESEGAQVFRTSITCFSRGATVDSVERNTELTGRALALRGAVLTVQQDQQAAVVRSALPACGYQSPTGLSLLHLESAEWWPDMLSKNRQRLV